MSSEFNRDPDALARWPADSDGGSGRGLHRFALLTAAATFCLLWVGGLVTSHGAGLAVPDWPTTYGYNMFLFPISHWTGGILYEHSHRLVASVVGFLTIILAVWLWLAERRPWLRRLGVIAVVAVVVQGILGGLRVTALKDELGIFHATLAQLFFILICSIALFTSSWWGRVARGRSPEARPFGRLAVILSSLVLLQLMLGATMRHRHAGLAIPDFPAAYGWLWPATDANSVARYNRERLEVVAANPITAGQIHLQMAHRITALLILVGTAVVARRAHRRLGQNRALIMIVRILLTLVLVQALLGAWTIWSNKAADIATAHVAVGALSLLASALVVMVARRTMVGGHERHPAALCAESGSGIASFEGRAAKA